MKEKILLAALSLGLMLLTCCQSNQKHRDADEQTVHISMTSDPQSLDPRLERALDTTTILHALYEGLMRCNMQGEPIPALAEKIDLSPDHTTYTFTLKKSAWSNGDPLTAHDFVATWRQILQPDFPAPNAYQFYVIKGAKAAKEGKIPVEEVSIQAPNPLTLVVELETPTPYFLELLTSHFFYPVHPKFSANEVITNGPFKLDSWTKHSELTLVKNPRYWDAREVRLHKLVFMPLDEHTALRMYQNGELEWAGSPMGSIPQDSTATLKHRKELRITPGAGTHWFRVNTSQSPFQSAKMRKAFAYAIDRKALVEHVLLGGQKPAMAIVPPSFHLHPSTFFHDNDTPAAWYLFQEALEDLHMSKDNIPAITLCYSNTSRNHKVAQAIQQQWKKALNIEVKLENCEAQIFYDRIGRQDYQVAFGSWFADFHDPINFLEIFKSKDNKTNNTFWENPEYTQLLDKSATEFLHDKRKEILSKAEAILMQEMPVIPICFSSFNYVKSDNLLGVYFSDLGYLDFKFAFYENF